MDAFLLVLIVFVIAVVWVHSKEVERLAFDLERIKSHPLPRLTPPRLVCVHCGKPRLVYRAAVGVTKKPGHDAEYCWHGVGWAGVDRIHFQMECVDCRKVTDFMLILEDLPHE